MNEQDAIKARLALGLFQLVEVRGDEPAALEMAEAMITHGMGHSLGTVIAAQVMALQASLCQWGNTPTERKALAESIGAYMGIAVSDPKDAAEAKRFGH